MRTTDTDRLGDEIAELAAHVDAAIHRLLTLIRQFDDAGGWADQGALSCAHWLSWRIGLDLGAAREHVRAARAIADLPLVDDALGRGQVSYSKVRALTRVATPATEASLLDMARSSTASQLERICRGYRLALRNASNERPEDEPNRRWVRERETDEGMVRFDAQLRPDEAAIVRRALEAAIQQAWNVSAETPPASLRRADALVAVAEQYLAGGTTDHSDAAASGAPAAGSRLPFSGVHEPTRRRPPRRAVGPRRRDDAREPVLAVSAAHTRVHEHGFRVERDGAGEFRFVRPDGREVTAVASPVLAGDPVAALRAQHQADGLAIDAWTGFPRWDGRPADYDHAVFCLVGTRAAGTLREAFAPRGGSRGSGVRHRGAGAIFSEPLSIREPVVRRMVNKERTPCATSASTAPPSSPRLLPR